eukprot:4945555-Amphidinium_carterae.1
MATLDRSVSKRWGRLIQNFYSERMSQARLRQMEKLSTLHHVATWCNLNTRLVSDRLILKGFLINARATEYQILYSLA